ncbi:MAG: DUF4258 domain-containing protein [bacterium]
MDIKRIREKVRLGLYEVSKHAEVERRKDGLEIKNIKTSIFNGKIIETYPDDPRNPGCLIFGVDESNRSGGNLPQRRRGTEKIWK